MTQNKRSSNSWVGIVLILVGALFLLDTFNILDFGGVISEWWPAIFIVIGLMKLKNQDRGAGLIFIIVGGVLLLTAHDVFNWSDVWKLWPILLILFGLSLVFKGRHSSWGLTKDSAIGSDSIHTNAIFGGAEHTVTSQNFQGGEAMALFGGVELDLREAKLSQDGCKIHATALFGGVELTVPNDWNVIVTGTPILGGIENKSRGKADGDVSKQLHLNCTVAFGGIEIK